MISDPFFYAVAVPAVILFGLSKGGFGGGVSMIGFLLMTLAVPPLQAAAIMLPILIVMDVVGLIAWRGIYEKRSLVILLPAALCGDRRRMDRRRIRQQRHDQADGRCGGAGFRR